MVGGGSSDGHLTMCPRRGAARLRWVDRWCRRGGRTDLGGGLHGSGVGRFGGGRGSFRLGLSDQDLEPPVDPVEQLLLFRNKRGDGVALAVDVVARLACGIPRLAEMLDGRVLIRGRRPEGVDEVGLVAGRHRLVGQSPAEIVALAVEHDLQRLVVAGCVCRHGIAPEVIAVPVNVVPGPHDLTLGHLDPASELRERELRLIEVFSEHRLSYLKPLELVGDPARLDPRVADWVTTGDHRSDQGCRADQQSQQGDPDTLPRRGPGHVTKVTDR